MVCCGSGRPFTAFDASDCVCVEPLLTGSCFFSAISGNVDVLCWAIGSVVWLTPAGVLFEWCTSFPTGRGPTGDLWSGGVEWCCASWTFAELRAPQPISQEWKVRRHSCVAFTKERIVSAAFPGGLRCPPGRALATCQCRPPLHEGALKSCLFAAEAASETGASIEAARSSLRRCYWGGVPCPPAVHKGLARSIRRRAGEHRTLRNGPCLPLAVCCRSLPRKHELPRKTARMSA